MTKKFFSLISGDVVTMAPGEKILPAKEYSALVDTIELAARLEEDTKEVQKKAKKKGYDEGYQEGLVHLNKNILALDQEIKTLHAEIQKHILPLALKAARKIVGEELKLHPDRIVDIVLNSLKPVTQHKRITIYVNRADLAILEKEKETIKAIFEKVENLSLQERSDVEVGGCIIETEAGIINAQLENQWRALEAAFEAFGKK